MKTLIASLMRLNSERVPQKLLAPVGSVSLAEIMLGKLLHLKGQWPDKVDVAMAVCPTDRALVEIANRLQCPLLERSPRSRDGESYQEIYGELREYLKQLNYRRFVVVNPCQPFLRVETIAEFLRSELDDPQRFEHSRVAVLRHRGWVWNQDFQLIHGDQTPNTKFNPEFHVLSHALYSYPVQLLGTPAQMEFRHFVAFDPGPEFIDIDTAADLEFARRHAVGMHTTAVYAAGAS